MLSIRHDTENMITQPARLPRLRYRGKVECAQTRKMREWNKPYYRLAHWPLWVLVFFLAPGSSTFALLEHGLRWGNGAWLLMVVVGTAVAGVKGLLPGMEARPYILRFDEDKPNPVYRRICYTFAWNAVLTFALLNLGGLLVAAITGVGHLEQIYRYGYPPLCVAILLLGMAGLLPRTGISTKREGTERRYFYGSVWAVTVAQTLLLAAWKMSLHSLTRNYVKLTVFVSALLLMVYMAYCGALPRTKPIVTGELVVAD